MGNAAISRMEMNLPETAPKTIDEIGDRTFRVKERMWSLNTVGNLRFIWCRDMLNGTGAHKDNAYPGVFPEIQTLQKRGEELAKQKVENKHEMNPEQTDKDIESINKQISDFKAKECPECIRKYEFRLDKVADSFAGECVVLGAGPSLLDKDDNVLPKMSASLKRSAIPIIVCDRSLIPLLKEGIIPKYVVAADGVDHVIKYFKHDLVKQAIKEHGLVAIFNVQIHPSVSQLWCDEYGGKVMWYNVALDEVQKGKSLSRYLFHMTNDNVISVPWGHVAAYCGSRNVEVITKNNLQNITKIKIGDEVLTNGGWVPVSNTFQRHYKGKLVKITPSNLNLQCELTPEHKVLTRRYFRKRFGDRQHNKWGRKKFELDTFEWKRADELRVRKNGDYDSDMLIVPRIKQTKTIESVDLTPTREGLVQKLRLTDDILELCGWYVAEGWVADARIGISNTNTSFVERIESLANNMGYESRVQKQDRSNSEYKPCYNVWIYNKQLTTLINSSFSNGCNNKHLPSWVFDLSNEQLIPLLRGMFLGDGSKYALKCSTEIGYTTKSKTLIIQLWQILTRFGLVASIKYNKKKNAYSLIIPISSGGLDNVSTWKQSDYKQRWRLDEDNVYLPVRKIEQIDYDDMVYDLSSGGSFCAPFVVHNCFGLGYLIGYNPIIFLGVDTGFRVNEDAIEDTPYWNPYFKAIVREHILKQIGVKLGDKVTLERETKFKEFAQKIGYDDSHEYMAKDKEFYDKVPELHALTIKEHFHFYTNPFGNKVYHDNIFKAYKDIMFSFFVANPRAKIIQCSEYTSWFPIPCDHCGGKKQVNQLISKEHNCYKCKVTRVEQEKGALIPCPQCLQDSGKKNEKGETIYEPSGIKGNSIQCISFDDYLNKKLEKQIANVV